jgi:hypothetical protein
MEYSFTCEKVRDLFVRALMKAGGDESELIDLKYGEGVKRKSQSGMCVGT